MSSLSIYLMLYQILPIAYSFGFDLRQNHQINNAKNYHHDQPHPNLSSHFSRQTLSLLSSSHSLRGGAQDTDKDNVNDNSNEDINDVQPQYSLPENDDSLDGSPCKHGLILMDSFCPYHGGYLSQKAKVAYNAGIVHLLSDYVLECIMNEDGDEKEEQNAFFDARIPKTDKNIQSWLDSIPFEIKGIICESDSGLDDAEKFGVAIGLHPDRHDGYNPARRDKFLMNQVVGEKGLRVVRQKFCSTVDDALTFARDELNVSSSTTSIETERSTWGSPSASSSLSVANDLDDHEGLLGQGTNLPFAELNNNESGNGQQSSYCVVKPCRGVASDDVYFCKNLEEVETAFRTIHNTNVFGCAMGKTHESVLVQEFAKGTEYALDIVSKNGEHKVACLWRYDKRPANKAPFVYFATEVINAETQNGRDVCNYATDVLDSLDIKWGLSHVEVILLDSEDNENGRPVLVEVNCRQHNTDFVPLTSISIGYNALDLLLSAYLGDNSNELPLETEHLRLDWDEIPILSKPRAFAAIVHLVNYAEGEVVGLNEDVIAEIENLPSVLAMEIYDHFGIGNQIRPTIDIRSDSGWCHIMNDEEEQFIADYERIVELMPQMFIVENETL